MPDPTPDRWYYNSASRRILDGCGEPIARDVAPAHGPTLAAAGRMVVLLRTYVAQHDAMWHNNDWLNETDGVCRCGRCADARALLAELDAEVKP